MQYLFTAYLCMFIPSIKDEPSSYAAVDTTEVVKQECFVRHHNNPSTARKIRRRGPGGFASVEDLMHRLFVAISGVADQLQTNYAKDLRVILKHVFTVCQSDPEPLTTSSEDVKYSGALAHSPLTASEGKLIADVRVVNVCM